MRMCARACARGTGGSEGGSHLIRDPAPKMLDTQVNAQEWLALSTDGICAMTEHPGNCDFGSRGSFGLTVAEAKNNSSAASACLAKCARCARCRFITTNLAFGDCSWYARCPPASELSLRGKGFRSGDVRRSIAEAPHQGASSALQRKLNCSRKRTVALLLRGQMFRWGCSQWGRQVQTDVWASYIGTIIRPLQERHHTCVTVFAHAVHHHQSRTDINPSAQLCDGGTEPPLRAAFGAWLEAVKSAQSGDQSESFRSAIEWFMQVTRATGGMAFEHVFLARHDVELLQPLTAWNWIPDRSMRSGT